MQIQWYPGHMAKAKRMLEENLKLIDVVVELVDARAPVATRNPDFDALFVTKRRVIVLNKADLADPDATARFLESYRNAGITAVEFVSTDVGKRKSAVALISRAAKDIVERYAKKGVSKTVRAMVVGIPNVGKSTFINAAGGVARAQVGDKPGVTRGKQWVKITPYLELMDTPGLMWPKLEDETLARHVAYIGSINDDIMDAAQLAGGLLSELMQLCPDAVTARYKKCTRDMDAESLLTAVCESRGFRVGGGEYDTERAARTVLDEYRAGRIARVTLDRIGAADGENS